MFTTPSSWPYSRCGSYGGGNQPPTITKEQNSLFFQHTITKEILTNGEEYGGFSFPNQMSQILGNGYITARVINSNYGTPNWYGVMVRDMSGSLNREPMVAVSMVNRRSTSTNFPMSSFRVVNGNTQIVSIYNFDHGMAFNPSKGNYVKLERVENTFNTYYSEEGETWIFWNSVTLTSSAVTWGLHFYSGTGEGNMTEITYGNFNNTGCGAGNVCRYKDFTGLCVPDPSIFPECGVNQWRYLITGYGGPNNIYYNFRAFPTYLSLNSSFISTPSKDADSSLFVFKLLNGNGILQFKIQSTDGILNLPSHVGVKVSGLNGPSPDRFDTFTCLIQQTQNFTAFKRTAQNGFDYSVTVQNVMLQPGLWLGIEKTNTTLKCLYSLDGNIWNSFTAAQPFTINDPFAIGIVSGSGLGYTRRFNISNILYQGFTGVCNNNGNCGTPASNNIDQCICPNSYMGQYCENFACFGLAPANPSVCSGNGICSGPNTCICNTNYAGSDCSFPKCFGISSQSSTVCSSSGTCVGVDLCNCNSGYTNTSCNIKICNSILSNNPAVCSSRGSCIAPDTCSCQANYTGQFCEFPVCFGRRSDNINVCSGKGTCTSANTCVCQNGYTGVDCSIPICYNVLGNSSTVCSGKGTCSSPNNCTCQTGYGSSTCNATICFGILATNTSNVCSGRGSCVQPNICSCQSGYFGSDCSVPRCFGILGNSSSVCSGKGSCSSLDNCACQPGYIGSDCSIPVCYGIYGNSSSVCSGNGICLLPNNCVCNSGYNGTQCQNILCFGIENVKPNVCSSRGTCLSPNTCSCQTGYNGTTCQNTLCFGIENTKSNVCSGKGTCVSPDNCTCSNGYYSSNCSRYDCYGKVNSDATVCSGTGTCSSPNNCTCQTGYGNSSCNVPICYGFLGSSGSACSGKGSCVSPNNCVCSSGYNGTQCQNIVCTDLNNCSGRGTCVGPNTCSCNAGYGSANCSLPICNGILSSDSNVCSGRGTCISPNNCTCINTAYTGSNCNITACLSLNSCNGNGICVGPNNCSCFPYWTNSSCNVFTCQNNCSFPKGSCVGPNTCNCTSQWSGPDCSSPICFSKGGLDPTVCSGRGNCISFDQCNCTTNYTGFNCQFSSCFGLNSSNPSVCNSRGNCIDTNTCNCSTGYTGSLCENFVCFGNSSASPFVCNGRGSCNGIDNCTCSSQYTGSKCEIPVCYSISASKPSVCSGKGSCLSPDTCSCNNGYLGPNCQYQYCSGVPSNSSNTCSGNGNCTGLNQCTCIRDFYGSNCDSSYLWNFINETCTSGCTLNMTNVRNCILSQGVRCYCNSSSVLESSTFSIQCNAQKEVTLLKIQNINLQGTLGTSLKNLLSLKTLDLANNKLNINTPISQSLPDQIQNVNLRNNSLTNQAEFYEITPSFTSLTNLTLDSNSICGVYPLSWQNKIYLNGHSKTLWCKTLSSYCMLLQIQSSYVMFPNENVLSLIINSSVSQSCTYYSTLPNMICESKNMNETNVIRNVPSSVNQNIISCSRGNFISDIQQIITIGWNYSSTSETISTNLNLTNLPFINIISSDRYLFSFNDASSIITLFTDQNLNLYKKLPNHKVKCRILPNDIYLDATLTGTSLTCNLSSVPIGIKNISIYDDSNTIQLSTNSVTLNIQDLNLNQTIFVFGNPIILGIMGNIAIKSNTVYSLINGTNSQNFTINNSFLSTSSFGVISSPYDITVLNLNLRENNYVVKSFKVLVYRNTTISSFTPLSTLVGLNTQFNITLQSSITSSDTPVSFYFRRSDNFINKSFSSTNANFLSFNDSSATEQSINYSICFLIAGFPEVILANTNTVYFSSTRSLIPETSTVFTGILNQLVQFNFTFDQPLPVYLNDKLKCSVSGQIFNVNYISSTLLYTCFINFTIPNGNIIILAQEGTFTYSISTFINYNYFGIGPISFNSSSTTIGIVNTNYNPVLRFSQHSVPQSLSNLVFVRRDGAILTTISNGTSFIGMNLLSNTPSVVSLDLALRRPSFYKIPSISSGFRGFITIGMNSAGFITLSITSYFRVVVQTSDLISDGKMKSDCSDLSVVFNQNIQIPRIITSCNTLATNVFFNMRGHLFSGDSYNYTIYYGNDYVVNSVSVTTSTLLNPTYTYTTSNDIILSLSSNTLQYPVHQFINVLSADPMIGFVSRPFFLTLKTDFNGNSYNGIIDYQLRLNNTFFNANFTNDVIQSFLFSNFDKVSYGFIIAVNKISGEKISVSGQGGFQFYNTTRAIVEPFVLSYDGSSINQVLYFNVSYPLPDTRGLRCRIGFKNNIYYFNMASINPLSCSISLNQLVENVEVIDVDLFFNVSSNSSLNFAFTDKSISIPIFKNQIHFNIDKELNSSMVNQYYYVNFTNPLKMSGKTFGFYNYSILYSPANHSSLSQNLNCIDQNSMLYCLIPKHSYSFTPILLSFTMSFLSLTSQTMSFEMKPIYFIEQLTLIQNVPYLMDPSSSPTLVYISLNKQLNSNFTYRCENQLSYSLATLSSNSSILSCTISPISGEKYLNISLSVLEFNFINIMRHTYTIELFALKFEPNIVNVQGSTTLTIVRMIHRFYKYLQVTHVTSKIDCNKLTISQLLPFSIFPLSFSLKYNVGSGYLNFTEVKSPLITYQTSNIVSISPLSIERGQNMSILITHNGTVFTVGTQEQVDFYCQQNSIGWKGAIINSQTIRCFIPYTDHDLNSLNLTSTFKIPQLSSQTFNISGSNSNLIFYYLDKGLMKFKNVSQERFFYSLTSTNITFDLYTFIPSNHYNLVTCRDNLGAIYPTSFVSYKSNSGQFTVTCTITSSTPGIRFLSLWISSGVQYQISNNTLDVMFVTRTNIISFSPLAAIANLTTPFQFTTTFTAANYSLISSFYCKYGLNATRTSNSSLATISNDFLSFQCNIFHPIVDDQIYLSLWMSVYGEEKRITNTDTLINVVTANYFTPSYGVPSGGENVTILTYSGVATNVTFNQTNQFIFPCTRASGSLFCVTPNVGTSLSSFRSYLLTFTANSLQLSAQYILYEKRNIINYNPRVIPMSIGSYSLFVDLDLNLTTIQGSLYVVFASKLIHETRTNAGTLSSRKNFTISAEPLTVGGISSMEIFYYHPNSFEIQNMFSISPKVNLTFIRTSSISTMNNTFYVNTINFVNVTLDQDVYLSSLQYQDVKCKLGNQYVNTIYISSFNYQCQVTSNSSKVDALSLWYNHPQAHNGEIKISTNDLNVIFISLMNLTSIFPYASITSSSLVSMNTTLLIDAYGTNVDYLCENQGSFSTATRSQNQFSCLISNAQAQTYIAPINIYLRSILSGERLLLSSNPQIFTFIGTLPSISSMFPFAGSQGNYSQNITLTLSIPLIINKGLYCKFISDIIEYQPADYLNGNQREISCKLEKSTFNQTYQPLLVGLTLIQSQSLSFDISNTFENFIFVKTPISWISSRSLIYYNYTSLLFNFTVPLTNTYLMKASVNLMDNVMTYSNGQNPSFTLSSNIISQINSLPSTISVSLVLTHPNSSKSISFDAESLYYFSMNQIQHIKPFIISYKQYLYAPARIILNLYQNINRNFTYQFDISQGGLSKQADGSFSFNINEIQPLINQTSHILFNFTTFGSTNSLYNVSLNVLNPLTQSFVKITSTISIQVIDTLQLFTTKGPSNGGTRLTLTFTSFTYPTFYSNYSISMKLYDRDSYLDMNSCIFYESGFLECSTPSIDNIYKTWNEFSKKIRVDLIINNMRSMSLTPFFTFYKQISVLSVKPSQYLHILKDYTIEFTLSSFEYQGSAPILSLTPISSSSSTLFTCVFNQNTLSCPNVRITLQSEFNSFISLNEGTNIVPLNTSLFFFTQPSSTGVSTTSLSISQFTDLYINIPFVFNSSDITLTLYDTEINIQVKGTYVSSSQILARIPPFYDQNYLFPKTLSITLSLDGGKTIQKLAESFTVLPFSTIKITNLIPVNVTVTGLELSGFPSLGIGLNQGEQLIFRLSSQDQTRDLTCYSSFTKCDLTQPLNFIGFYQLQVVVKQGSIEKIVYVKSNTVEVYQYIPTFTVSPSLYIFGSKLPLTLVGNFTSLPSQNIRIGFIPTVVFSTFNSKVSSIKSTGIEVVPPSTLSGSPIGISISFNDIYYHPTNVSVPMINDYSILASNPDNIKNPNNFFSFLRSNVSLTGNNLFNTGKVKLILKNENLNIDITSLSPISFISTKSATFLAPLITDLNIQYTIQYPLILKLGLSLNDGFEYRETPFIYVNQYPLPIYTGIFPTVSPIKPLNVTIYGLNLDLAVLCSIYISSNKSNEATILEVKPIQIGQSNSIICPLPILQTNASYSIFLKNLQNGRTENSYDLFFYETPVMLKVYPSISETYSRQIVALTGKFTPYLSSSIYCRLGGFLCDEFCTLKSESEISCKLPAVPAGDTSFSISYNKIDWHTSLNYTFTPCEAGYESKDYQTPCTLCKPGYYKQTSGIYSCLPCNNGTYSQFSGSILCEKCAENTTTISTATQSVKDCVCLPGYYVNPNSFETTGSYKKCIDCPVGALCSNYNTTIPKAKPGYWFSQNDLTTFYSCFPAASCPGGGSLNCTNGYSGNRCGYCSKGFYKEKHKCNECGSIFFNYIKLLALIALLGIIGVLFLLVTTYFPTLLTSISITVQYWQVLSIMSKFDINWPDTIKGTLSASTVSVLNFDFLSTDCIFPDFNFTTLWILKMLVPLYFTIIFGAIYLIAELRTIYANYIGKHITKLLKCKYTTPYKYESSDEEGKTEEEMKGIRKQIATTNKLLWVKNQFIWLKNTFVWWSRYPSSRSDLKFFFNKVLNSYSALISFVYIFLMTTASEIFICTQQSNGSYTLDSSPDIFCYSSPTWWYMFPLSILAYLIFGVGIIIYFLVMIYQYRRFGDDIYFKERFKFLLLRFKKKYFFWKLVETLRFLILTFLNIFFKPLLVVVFGLLVIFISLLLHFHYVPFMRKFHNVMEYFMLMAILFTFFFSVLFLADISKYPSKEFYFFIVVCTITVIIISNILAVLMTVWDIFVRQRNIGKRSKKNKEKRRGEKVLLRKEERIIKDLHGDNIQLIDEKTDLPFDVEFDFHFRWREIVFSSESEDEMTMNDILLNLISWQRMKSKFSKQIKTSLAKLKVKKIKPGETEKKKERRGAIVKRIERDEN